MKNTKDKICEYLKEGLFKKDAAVLAGISEKTLYRWIEEDDSFDSRVEASIIEFKRTLVKNIKTCSEKDGRLALQILIKRFPSDWDMGEVEDDEDNSVNKIAQLLQRMYLERRTRDEKIKMGEVDQHLLEEP